MYRLIFWSTLSVYSVWSLTDWVLSATILKPILQSHPELWRPADEMKIALYIVVTIVCAAAFVLIYLRLVDRKNLKTALVYGLLFGIISGATMGFGTYSTMPIPPQMAWISFGGSLFKGVVAGLVLRYFYRPKWFPAPYYGAVTGDA